jgi:outer membrane protein, multidrug efflux system
MVSKINSAKWYPVPLLMIVWLGACKVGQNYQRPAVPAPAQFRTTDSGVVPTGDTLSIADMGWKQFFTDATLQGLISRGIANNYDLQLAVKRIQASNAQVKQARLAQLPTLDLGINAQTQRPSDNSLGGISDKEFLGHYHIEDYNVTFSTSWEADIWGKIRRQKEATLAQYLQTYEAAKAVQTQMVADIAQGYYNLLMLDAQLEIARKNLALTDSTFRVTRLQRDAGDVTSLAVEQAEAQMQSTAALVPQIEQSISVQENALSILIGETPGAIARNVTLTQLSFPDSLPAGIPSTVVSRRPDVRSNEMALIAANAQVGVAQAKLYPSFTITASGGLDAYQFINWFNIPGSLFGMVAGGLAQPLFEGRKLRTQLEIAKVQRDEAAIQFKQSVVNAMGEVSDALVKVDKLKQQQQITAAQVKTLHHAINDAQLLFKSGMANYLEVITAQSSALTAELSLADVERQQLSTVVDLYRSLGGGWK